MEQSLQDAYALASRPFLEAPNPVPATALSMKSWRYVIEVNSACNLRCVMCASGNRKGYCHVPGIMDMDLYERVLDKAKTETPEGAVVCCYANSEPLLHPRMDEVVAHAKRRGFICEVSSNLNVVNNLEKVIAQKPDIFTVSVSGFSQAVYEKTHRGGDIELFKKNLLHLSKIRNDGNQDVRMIVSYHKYNDNQGDELEQMKAYAEGLGFEFMTSWARAIVMEPLIQALRYLEAEKTGQQPLPYDVRDGLDLNALLPQADPEFVQNLNRLHFHPLRCMSIYERFPIAPVCLIGDVFTYVRHDGKVGLCPWADDMRLNIGNYMDMTQEQLSELRRGHPLCRECLRLRLNLYFHIIDPDKWD